MANAIVGDDVFGDDPTVNRLQDMAATLMGKESGLFVPSGTMGNLIAVLTHCNRGDEVILGSKSHTFLYEAGGISALGSVHSCQIPNLSDGSISLDEVRTAIRTDNVHYPSTKLICLENTQNRCGGVALSVEFHQSVYTLAKNHNLQVHLDGARIFNASTALGVKPIDLASQADSVTFCLSKGLCAPVGSVLCGNHEFIAHARRIRKQLGGGMRQAGILAAAGIIALEKMTERLGEDHKRAKVLAQGISSIPEIKLDEGSPYTNMIFFELTKDAKITPIQLEEQLRLENILVSLTDTRFRLVTHYWIDDAAVEQTIAVIRSVLA
jgi:threonine aldolase